MESVYLLVALSTAVFIGLGIYLIVILASYKVKKNMQQDLIKKAIVNNDENCSCCSGNCEIFVDAVIKGKKSIDDCPKITMHKKEEIKKLLDVQPKVNGAQVAVVFCKGGARAVDQYGYVGHKSCDYSNKIFDGLKVCEFGCQGCMDCATVCPTGAIKKNAVGVAEVDRSLCIGCGECTKKCPDKLIGMIDLNQDIVITCKQAHNQKSNAEVANFCSVGCTKCGECVKVCPTNAIYVENDIIKFKRSACISCGKCVNVCPNSTITHIKGDFLNF